MPLLAYNKTMSPLLLAASTVPVTLPASATAGVRGDAVNVTSKLCGLTETQYHLLMAQVTAGSLEVVWDGEPEYTTTGLAVPGGVHGFDVSQTTTADVDLYVDGAIGNDGNDGSVTNPVKTTTKALSLVPHSVLHKVHLHITAGLYDEHVHIHHDCAEGVLVLEGAVARITGEMVRTITDIDMATGEIEVGGAPWTGHALRDSFVRCLTGGQAGQYCPILDNSTNRLSLGLFAFMGFIGNPIQIGDTFEIVEPMVEFTNLTVSKTGGTSVSQKMGFSTGGGVLLWGISVPSPVHFNSGAVVAAAVFYAYGLEMEDCGYMQLGWAWSEYPGGEINLGSGGVTCNSVVVVRRCPSILFLNSALDVAAHERSGIGMFGCGNRSAYADHLRLESFSQCQMMGGTLTDVIIRLYEGTVLWLLSTYLSSLYAGAITMEGVEGSPATLVIEDDCSVWKSGVPGGCVVEIERAGKVLVANAGVALVGGPADVSIRGMLLKWADSLGGSDAQVGLVDEADGWVTFRIPSSPHIFYTHRCLNHVGPGDGLLRVWEGITEYLEVLAPPGPGEFQVTGGGDSSIQFNAADAGKIVKMKMSLSDPTHSSVSIGTMN